MSNGAESRHGTHHEAQTLSTVTWPGNSALSRPGTGLPARSGPARGGRWVGGGGWPFKAGEMRGGSRPPSRNMKSVASPKNTTSGMRTSIRARQASASFSTNSFPINSPLLPICASRAPADPPRFKLLQHACQVPLVEHDPCDQSSDDCDRGGIGSHDERGMRTEMHHHDPAGEAACSIIMLRTRRRMISLRMAARLRVRNKSVNAMAMTMRGTRIAGWIVDPPRRSTEVGWCSVFHQSTENLIMGMLIAPTSVSIAAARAACVGSSIVRHSAITPRYIRNKTSTEVNRASQTQYVPHIGRPHSEPVTRHISVKADPIGAAALPATSASG